MAILSLDEYKARRNVTTDAHDLDYEGDIEAAEDFIRTYTGRKFEDQVTETRTFRWRRSGVIETDDFTELTALSIGGYAKVDSWGARPGPEEGPTYYYVELGGRGSSPVMGFTRNEDVYAIQGLPTYRQTPFVDVAVTATWGFPKTPAMIRQAAMLLVDEYHTEEDDDAETALVSEAIADLSKAWQREGTAGADAELAPKIGRLLDRYVRISV